MKHPLMSNRAKPKRPRVVVAPNFGRQLTRLRGTQSRGKVCAALRRYGLTVHRSTLLQYEHGCIESPDPAILWALGRHYGLESIDQLLAVLVMDRTGRELRAGVDIDMSPFSPEARLIAESFSTFPPHIKQAISTVVAGLQAGDLSAALGAAKKHA